MSGNGKHFRLRHIFRAETGRCILFAASHGTSSAQLFKELDETAHLVDVVITGGADSVLISVGYANASADVFHRHPTAGFIAKVSATAFESSTGEIPIRSAESALAAGADGLGVMMQLTPSNESAVVGLVAALGEASERLGLPLLVEAELPSAYQEHSWAPKDAVAYLRRSCRLAEELGADIIKTNWPGTSEGFAEVISPVTKPVLVAGGPRISEFDLLQVIDNAISVGASGTSVGRNIFQADDPASATKQIVSVVHDRLAPSRA